ncbi:hypothetical protein EYF80_010512 [Liparis tanakae]|uniref:Uncharacterized protein n=1 Tax=Liparis tanakae TaxID=230148 RepID=A0A4Z2INB6_9TELE|nr:hypothetical protein EYF80_010512 [Liparis tanakae]
MELLVEMAHSRSGRQTRAGERDAANSASRSDTREDERTEKAVLLANKADDICFGGVRVERRDEQGVGLSSLKEPRQPLVAFPSPFSPRYREPMSKKNGFAHSDDVHCREQVKRTMGKSKPDPIDGGCETSWGEIL